MPVGGIHHVSAICGAPQLNIDFYVEVLGMRLVKRTVNYDNPHAYHLYYGDETGRPGTLLTFFPILDAVRGRTGSGMVGATAFAAPPGAVEYWMGRLADIAHTFHNPTERFGQPVLPLHDHDGLTVEIVEDERAADAPGWRAKGVDAEFGLRSLSAVTLHVPIPDMSARVLTEVLGFEEEGSEGDRRRFRLTSAPYGDVVDVIHDIDRARPGAGTVHHVAFRVADHEQQAAVADAARAIGLRVTDVRDRKYFESVYFREHGGVLFELATDGPGFGVDEAADDLGTSLQLPPWLEPRRPEIERRLPEIALPL